MAVMVQFQGVHKRFKGQNALQDLSFQVPEGVIYGLVGRNGAGKSTTLRMIMRLLQPDTGQIEVMGHAPVRMPLALRQQMGYSSDSLPLIPWLKAEQLLAENALFYPGWDASYVKSWAQKLELNLQKRVFSLSRGDRQKLAFLMAIGHRPRLLILDEPASGLDPVVRQQFLESLISFLNENGTTVILSSHQLNELERVADHIGLIQSGRMVLEADLESLRSEVRKVIFMGAGVEAFSPKHALLDVQRQPGYAEFVFRQWNDALGHEMMQLFPEASLQVKSLDLESIFIHLQAQEERHAPVIF